MKYSIVTPKLAALAVVAALLSFSTAYADPIDPSRERKAEGMAENSITCNGVTYPPYDNFFGSTHFTAVELLAKESFGRVIRQDTLWITETFTLQDAISECLRYAVDVCDLHNEYLAVHVSGNVIRPAREINCH